MNSILDAIRKLAGNGHVQSPPARDIYPIVGEDPFAWHRGAAVALEPPPRATLPVYRRDFNLPDEAITHHDPGAAAAEEYRALRTNLLASHPDGNYCSVVTSSRPGEGKTITCMNLAMVMAERENTRTVLVDCNFRSPRLSAMMRLNPAPGISDVLRGDALLPQAIQPTPYPSLFCISAGENCHNLSLLLATQQLQGIISELRRQFTSIIIDTPAIHVASDAAIIGAVVREALLVVRMYRTPRESADKAIRQLRASNVPVSGVVLTDRRLFIPDAFYRWL